MTSDRIIGGKYKVIRLLGQGGMSKVYLTENIKLGTLWAIKEINKKLNPKIDLLAEPNILKKLNHDALPRIFDIIEENEHIYIIVDYIEGDSLDVELTKVKRFSEDKVIEWGIQLCAVLDYLHTQKPNPIIYRDMKPSNIILTKDGTLKLIDFGIAREYKKESKSDTIYIGTRGYAAPEQYGAGQTTPSTDLYSLGVTLYHLLTGKSPNDHPYEFKPVRYFNKNLSRGIEYIIAKCIRKDPEERYQSAQELSVDLKIVSNKDRIRRIPTKEDIKKVEYVNFKKLVLTVWGNAEFACELAYMAAELTSFKVLLVNLDFIASKADIYLNVEDELKQLFRTNSNDFGFRAVTEALNNDDLSYEKFIQSCLRRRDVKNMYLLSDTYSIDNYKRYENCDISKIIDFSYQNFDITILIANTSVFDKFSLTALQKSDFNIVAIPASADAIREFETYMLYLKDKHNISDEKTKFVAYEYKDGINLPCHALDRFFAVDSYIGYISHHPEREKNRNIRTFYGKTILGKNRDEYMNILREFNIIPKITYMQKAKSWFSNLIPETLIKALKNKEF